MSDDVLKRFEIELPLTELKKDLVSQPGRVGNVFLLPAIKEWWASGRIDRR